MKKKSFYYWDWHTNNKHNKEMSLFIWPGKTKHSPTAKNDWLQITILDQPISHWAPENFKQILQIHEFLQEHSHKIFSVLNMIRWSVMKSSFICLNNKIHLPRGTLQEWKRNRIKTFLPALIFKIWSYIHLLTLNHSYTTGFAFDWCVFIMLIYWPCSFISSFFLISSFLLLHYNS